MKKTMKPSLQIKFSRNRAVIAITGFILFTIIAIFIMTNETLSFDTVIRSAIYSLRTDSMTTFFTAVTNLGNWQTITLICLAFLVVSQTRSTFGLPLAGSAILAVTVQKLLKLSFQRPRPDLSLHLISQGGYSFPSGHSFTIIVFYGLLIFLCRQSMTNKKAANWITGLLSCLILAIGFSRVYLGVHYPTDILGGWSLGLCLLMILISIKTKDKNLS